MKIVKVKKQSQKKHRCGFVAGQKEKSKLKFLMKEDCASEAMLINNTLLPIDKKINIR
jgi:hypothetical protein